MGSLEDATRNRSQFQNLPPPPLTRPPLHSLLPSGWPLSSLGAACGLPHAQATADPLPHPEHPTWGICKIRYAGSALTHPGAQDTLSLLPLTDGETQTPKARPRVTQSARGAWKRPWACVTALPRIPASSPPRRGSGQHPPHLMGTEPGQPGKGLRPGLGAPSARSPCALSGHLTSCRVGVMRAQWPGVPLCPLLCGSGQPTLFLWASLYLSTHG